ncbi:hypothetical protein AtDm6_1492 [Acetobacter tropicalis]|uniref:Uncharacterized protein n=1 Tax=Acetobacter tropicalis TaxID=104102 RepID=A0A094YP76_9PROT|nr:hypothetical protein AtDm6_1492 [Acetobacter tropicalis]
MLWKRKSGEQEGAVTADNSLSAFSVPFFRGLSQKSEAERGCPLYARSVASFAGMASYCGGKTVFEA